MTNSLAFKLVLLLLVAISVPLLEARPLGVRLYHHDDLHISLLALSQAETVKETSNSDDALLGNSGDMVASASPSSSDDAARHRLAPSPPSAPRPISRRPTNGVGQVSASSGPEVGGARRPSAPPPPGGPNPPHRQSSEQGGRPRLLVVDVSDVLLRVMQRMVC